MLIPVLLTQFMPNWLPTPQASLWRKANNHLSHKESADDHESAIVETGVMLSMHTYVAINRFAV